MLNWWSAKSNKWWLTIFLAPVVIYGIYVWSVPSNRFNTPDEVVQSFFSRRVASGEGFRAPSSLNKIAGVPVVRPRWVHIVNSDLVLAGFIGFPLILGFLGSIFGLSALPYLTPLFALCGLGVFYFLIRDLLNRRTAIFSAILMVFTPAYWYYHSRSFFHNALFFDLVLLGMWAYFQALKKQKSIFYLLTGVVLGLALAVRSSELVWLAVMFLVWSVVCFRQINWYKIVWLPLGLILGIMPVLVVNYLTYGQLFFVGYEGGITLPVGGNGTILNFIYHIVLPFGFHPRVIWQIFVHYVVELSWWWFILVLIGVVFLTQQWKILSREVKGLSLGILMACGWLLIMYGSWWFSDNPDPSAITIGSSYVRYFLPLYVLVLWPAGFALAHLWQKKYGKWLASGVVLIFILLSTHLVLWGKDEGLVYLQKRLSQFESVSQIVQSLTPVGSVIVTPGRTDKFFWPEREVIVSFSGESDYQAVGKLVSAHVPVYLFNTTFNDANFRKLLITLSGSKLTLEMVKSDLLGHTLYRFLPIN